MLLVVKLVDNNDVPSAFVCRVTLVALEVIGDINANPKLCFLTEEERQLVAFFFF